MVTNIKEIICWKVAEATKQKSQVTVEVTRTSNILPNLFTPSFQLHHFLKRESTELSTKM
jgi:hypothetical protein